MGISLDMLEIFRMISDSEETSILLGAGISASEVPPGDKMAREFATDNPDLMRRIGLDVQYGQAREQNGEIFARDLAREFATDSNLQDAFLEWMTRYGMMMGCPSDKHAIFVLMWLNRTFTHLITTNWDFLLESQLDDIYDMSYSGDPFEPVTYRFSDGGGFTLPADRLYFIDELGEEDAAWTPRWEIIADRHDVQNISPEHRPLWKIHGSPFLLYCPSCGGLSRWKREKELRVGDPCPEHPAVRLVPEIVLWDEGIDRARPEVWDSVTKRISDSDLVVVIGNSGNDTYIREKIEGHGNVIVINRSGAGLWDTDAVHPVEMCVEDLTPLLRDQFLS